MTTSETGRATRSPNDIGDRVARQDRFRERVVLPALNIGVLVLGIITWPSSHIIAPALTTPLFGVVGALAIIVLFFGERMPPRVQFGLITAYAVLIAVMLPMVHDDLTASFFPYLACATAGARLSSRETAFGVAGVAAFTAAAATVIVGDLAPTASQWSWWEATTIGLTVLLGTSRRDRTLTLLASRQAAEEAQRAAAEAQRAAEEAERATQSEKREAALEERARIAREIHDVLGHSLSGIAMQLEMADALAGNGREAEANAAIRRARALAVDSISETKRAVHALREDTLPLAETLRRMAESHAIELTVVGEPGPVSAESRHTVVRAAQEALTNATKYAPGARRAMTLAFTSDQVTLTMANGPATGETSALLGEGTGMGLVGMRERVALLGGTLRAGPNPEDGGWTVEVEVPR